MSQKDGRDYIYLVWKEPKSRRNYKVAQLSRNGNYQFQYGFEIDEAMKVGFQPLISFDDITKKYIDNKLFSPFCSRVPDKRRKGIEEILKKYKLNEYDEYELLKKTGGRLPIDNIEFIDPILENEENPIERIFYIAGVRYCIGCNGEKCEKSIDLKKDSKLKLQNEPENEVDEDAIKICTNEGDKVGYIPRYYNKELKKLILKGAKYELYIMEINKNKNCNECIKVNLKVSI